MATPAYHQNAKVWVFPRDSALFIDKGRSGRILKCGAGGIEDDGFIFRTAPRELDELRRAGVTPAQALTAATVHNAAYLGQPGALGRVEPGYRADLVLAGSNPLQDPTVLRRPLWVMLGGAVVAGRERPVPQ